MRHRHVAVAQIHSMALDPGGTRWCTRISPFRDPRGARSRRARHARSGSRMIVTRQQSDR